MMFRTIYFIKNFHKDELVLKKNEIETQQTHLIVLSWIEMSNLHWFKHDMRLPDLYFSVRVVGWYSDMWPKLRLSISTFYLYLLHRLHSV